MLVRHKLLITDVAKHYCICGTSCNQPLVSPEGAVWSLDVTWVSVCWGWRVQHWKWKKRGGRGVRRKWVFHTSVAAPHLCWRRITHTNLQPKCGCSSDDWLHFYTAACTGSLLYTVTKFNWAVVTVIRSTYLPKCLQCNRSIDDTAKVYIIQLILMKW